MGEEGQERECGCEGPRGLVLGHGMRQNWDRKAVLGTPLELPYSQWPAHEERRSEGKEEKERTEGRDPGRKA